MWTARNFFEPIAQSRQEILVGGDDTAFEGKFDHRLNPAYRGDLGGMVGGAQFSGRYVGREFDDLDGRARPVQDWV
jgi:hypothetical protein